MVKPTPKTNITQNWWFGSMFFLFLSVPFQVPAVSFWGSGAAALAAIIQRGVALDEDACVSQERLFRWFVMGSR